MSNPNTIAPIDTFVNKCLLKQSNLENALTIGDKEDRNRAARELGDFLFQVRFLIPLFPLLISKYRPLAILLRCSSPRKSVLVPSSRPLPFCTMPLRSSSWPSTLFLLSTSTSKSFLAKLCSLLSIVNARYFIHPASAENC
jgi:hypothetical protein